TLPPDAPPETVAFIEVHLLMLDDPVISEQPVASIRRDRKNAESALKTHADTLVAFFDRIEDPYLRSKKNDVHQIVDRVMNELLGLALSEPAQLSSRLDGQIIVTNDLTPAETVSLHQRGVSAFITSLGGPISHTAILARSLHIPAVVGLHSAIRYIRNDDVLIIDAANDTVIVAPDEDTLVNFHQRQKAHAQHTAKLALLSDRPAVTQDGINVKLLANIELPEDLPGLASVGAEGVGLYRTEFLFMNRSEPPTEDEQYEAYCQVLDSVSGTVTIRTLDLGADKQVDGGRADGEKTINPALGLRAIRLCLNEPTLFKPQLRAIFRAASRGDARIMIPMISSLDELDQALELVRETCRELEKESKMFNPDVPIGGMIEVPAAAIAADLFARKLKFLSIGTNDLIQYTLAVDRIDDEVNYLYDPLHPSVLRLIHQVIEAGNHAGIPVAMCGEMAGDPVFTRLLLGLGLREFSMEASSLPGIKQRILESRINELENFSLQTLDCLDKASLRRMVDQLNHTLEKPA
ncbi:MAG TPA: phosphoenolpyruvate--protein phosphotransferase, partial [Gammaproteobacteria bacterium]|nr:phosphoenolpyruvate--protein phosphotransferase [Gammaproteobacteria bacterium]